MQRLHDFTGLWSEGVDLIVPAGPDGAVRTDEVSIALVRMVPGDAPIPAHLHRAGIEIYVVIAGEGLLTVDAEAIPVAPGSVVLIERREVHSIAHVGEAELRYWAISTPAWTEADHILVEGPTASRS